MPSASAAIADPKGSCLFVDREVWEVNCPILHLPALFGGSDTRRPPRWANPQRFPGIYGSLQNEITADSARPETIDHLANLGFRIVSATKGAGSVDDGIEFLKSYDIVVHPRCRHLIDELIHYSWVIDRQKGHILSHLADRDNHVIDALRYALEGARKARSIPFDFATSGKSAFQRGLERWNIMPPPWRWD